MSCIVGIFLLKPDIFLAPSFLPIKLCTFVFSFETGRKREELENESESAGQEKPPEPSYVITVRNGPPQKKGETT